MTVRRLADFDADRSLIEAALDTAGLGIDFEHWRDHAAEPTSRVYANDDNAKLRGKLLHIDLWQPGRCQIVWWLPMAITVRSEFLETLPVLAEGIRQLRAEGLRADAAIYGHAPRDLCQAWGTYFGPIVTVEKADSNPEYPIIGGTTYRARSTLGLIGARIPELLAEAK